MVLSMVRKSDWRGRRAASMLAGLLAGVVTCGGAWAQAPTKIAITGGRIITVSGDDIAQGTVVVDNGRITAVGADVEIPFDAVEYDATGKVVFPGMIHPHAAGGMDVPNESQPVTPFLNVYDAIDPSRRFFEDALRDGVTTVHASPANNTVIGGVTRVVRPIGLSIAEMTVSADAAMKMSVTPKRGYDRMRQMLELREAFHTLDRKLEDLAEKRFEEDAEENDRTVRESPEERREQGRALIRDEDLGDDTRNLVRMRRGDMAAWIYAGAATDVGPALKITEDQELTDRTTLVLGATAHKAFGELEGKGIGVVLDESLFDRERDPFTGDIRETFVPKKAHDAGLLFALQPSPSSSLAERYLNYQAAVCVRNGVPRDAALKAITMNPAELLGLGDDLGSIDEGKIGNLVVFSGDPLDFNSWVEMVFIDGILAYERSKDHRLKELLRLEDENKAREAEEDEDADEIDAQDGADASEDDAAGSDSDDTAADGDSGADSSDASGNAPGNEGGEG
ncbi:MAG: amidohydrolase family protein [Planctomycetota bacterium]